MTSRKSWMDDLADEHRQAVPGDLDADAEEDEGDDAEDSVGGGGGDALGDARGVGVAEVDDGAEQEDGDHEAGVGEEVLGDGALRGAGAEGEHEDDASGAGGDGEGEGV